MADSKDIDVTIAVAGMQKLGEAFSAFGDIVGQSLGATFEAVATLHRELKPSDDEHAARAAYQWYESAAREAVVDLDSFVARVLTCGESIGHTFTMDEHCTNCGATRQQLVEIKREQQTLVDAVDAEARLAMTSTDAPQPKGDRYTRAIDLT